MNNKICGECKHFVTSDYLDVCVVECETRRAGSICTHCGEFKPRVVTNGDTIRQMSNEGLAQAFGFPCPPLPNKHCNGSSNEECTKCWLAWLNAPARK